MEKNDLNGITTENPRILKEIIIKKTFNSGVKDNSVYISNTCKLAYKKNLKAPLSLNRSNSGKGGGRGQTLPILLFLHQTTDFSHSLSLFLKYQRKYAKSCLILGTRHIIFAKITSQSKG